MYTHTHTHKHLPSYYPLSQQLHTINSYTHIAFLCIHTYHITHPYTRICIHLYIFPDTFHMLRHILFPPVNTPTYTTHTNLTPPRYIYIPPTHESARLHPPTCWCISKCHIYYTHHQTHISAPISFSSSKGVVIGQRVNSGSNPTLSRWDRI